MARGDFVLFNDLVTRIGTKKHGLVSDVIKLGIINNVATPVATQAAPKWTTYSANEVIADGGYIVGGLTIANQSFVEDAGVGTFDGDNLSLDHNVLGFENGYWGILYNSTDADKYAFGFVDLGGPVSEVEGPVIVNWNAEGIFKISIYTP